MRLMVVLPMIALAGCLASRIQSRRSQGTDSSSSRLDPAQRLSPTAFEQNASITGSFWGLAAGIAMMVALMASRDLYAGTRCNPFGDPPAQVSRGWFASPVPQIS